MSENTLLVNVTGEECIVCTELFHNGDKVAVFDCGHFMCGECHAKLMAVKASEIGMDGEDILARSASMNSYGHTGFTGACVWVDPEEELVYVFLSNRVYPSARNGRINRYDIRERIHEVVYKALRDNALSSGNMAESGER